MGDPRRIALVFGSFKGGGVARVMLRLARSFLEGGLAVDLLVGRDAGPLRPEVPARARLVTLERGGRWATYGSILRADPGLAPALAPTLLPGRALAGKFRHLDGLRRYLARERPDGVIAATAPLNLAAVWARSLVRLEMPVVVTEHNQLAGETLEGRRFRYDCPHPVLRRGYLQASAIVAVSSGVADELAREAAIPRARISTIFNPIGGPEIAELAARPSGHPWLEDAGPPVVLGVGMIKPQKDFATLIRAVAAVRRQREVRFILLGGPRKGEVGREGLEELKALAVSLGIGNAVDFPGFVANPFAYLSRAALFVLSSRWEGLANVLIEALACGCPVVSTDCPSGPREILDGGRIGPLVPVGDHEALAAAMLARLDQPADRARLLERAAQFDRNLVAQRYLELLNGPPRR